MIALNRGLRDLYKDPVDLILAGSLALLVISLMFARGSYVIAVAGLVLGLGLRLIRDSGLARPPPLSRLLGFLALLLGLGLLPNRGQFAFAGLPLLQSMVIILAFAQRPTLPFRHWLYPLLTAFVALHLFGDLIYKGPPHRGYPGLFKNIHFLAEYAVLMAPVMVALTVKARGRARLLMGLLLCLDLALLLGSKSRPGFMALVASIVVVLPWLQGRQRGALLLLAGGTLGALYALDVLGFASRINEFLAHIREDERAEIWSGTLGLLEGNSPWEWLFGHGLGQFLVDYHALSLIRQTKTWIGPHNFVLEILYSHGATGLILVLGSGLMLSVWVVRQIRAETDPDRRSEVLVLLAMMTGLLVHAFFTVPFFSRDFLLPLAVILGLWIWRRRPLPPPIRGQRNA